MTYNEWVEIPDDYKSERSESDRRLLTLDPYTGETVSIPVRITSREVVQERRQMFLESAGFSECDVVTDEFDRELIEVDGTAIYLIY